MREFDGERRERFFNTVFPQAERANMGAQKLRHRDLLTLRLLGPSRASGERILDFGCGQGRFLAHLVSKGYNAYGMEKHAGMRSAAQEELGLQGAADRVLAGGVEELERQPAGSCSTVATLGVMQYLSDDEYARAAKAIARLLQPGGTWISSFQNALFDLYTFNKYSVDFIVHDLLGPQLVAAEKKSVEQALGGLLCKPGAPDYAPSRARDNIFVRLSNPLTLGEEMPAFGFRLKQKAFYEWFGLPPLLGALHPDIARRVTQHYEIDNAADWRGHFMANAFLALLEKTA